MVRAIDQRESVLQSGMAERIQQVQQRHPELQQRYFEMQLSQEHRKRLQQVTEAQEKEALRFQGDSQREQHESARRQAPDPPPAGEGAGAAESADREEGQGRIDIKV